VTTQQAIRGILILANDTQAAIFGNPNCAEIESGTVRLIEWIRTQDTARFASWIDIVAAWKIATA